MDARTLHPAGKAHTSGDRCNAVAAMRRSLIADGIDVPTVPALMALECALDALDTPATRHLSRYDESWTPHDEAMLAEDDQVEDFAAWYEQMFGGET